LARRRSAFGLVIGGAPVIPDVFGQDTTPPAAVAPAQTEQEQEIDFEAQRAQAYDSFVASLASELGSDEATVDAAIRTALTQQVDEREAAGDLDIERAAAMRAVIEVSEAPLFLGFGGHGGMHGFDGRHGPGGRGGGDDRHQDDESPAGLPGDDEVSNQSASAPVMPAESVAIG
jgi:hypothetical protein